MSKLSKNQELSLENERLRVALEVAHDEIFILRQKLRRAEDELSDLRRYGTDFF